MNKNELVIGIAIILFVAFCLGWCAYWLMHRFTRVAGAETGELERLAQSLHEAEESRDEAVVYLQQREAELTTRISQGEQELKAANEALRLARSQVETLRTQLNKAQLRSQA